MKFKGFLFTQEKPFLGSESGASDEEQERLILNIVEDSTVLSSSHAEVYTYPAF